MFTACETAGFERRRSAIRFVKQGGAALVIATGMALGASLGFAISPVLAQTQGSESGKSSDTEDSFIDLNGEQATKLREAAKEIEPDLLAVILVPSERIGEIVVTPAAGYEQLPMGKPVDLVDSPRVIVRTAATIGYEGSKCKVKIVDGSPVLLTESKEEKERCLCKLFDIGC